MRYLLPLLLAALIFPACAAKKPVIAGAPVVQAPPVEQEEALVLPDIAAAPKPEVGDAEKKPVQPEKAEEKYVMLNFESADLDTVIATVGEMLKINYILAPGVSGKITIQSHNKIPLSELFSTFQTILEFNGLTAVKEGSFYRIVPIDSARQQPVQVKSGRKADLPKDASFVTQEVPLEYVRANDVANIVRNLMPRGTDIIVYEPSNMLLVTAPPSGIVKLLKLLETIDVPSTEQDAVKTFVYSVENGEAKKLAEILRNIYKEKKDGSAVRTATPAAPTPAPVPQPRAPLPRQRVPVATPPSAAGATVQEGLAAELEGDVVIEAYDDINALIIKATPRAYLSLLETIKRIDIQPRQVLIEVLIAEISLDDDTRLGIEWLLKSSIHAEGRDLDVIGGFTKGSPQFRPDTNTFIFPSKDNILLAPAVGFANVIDPRRFSIVLTAAAEVGNVNVLASPHILALDNKEAKIEIADEVPVATSISTPQTTVDNTISQVQYKSAGTILTVTPHINEKKQVTLKVSQEVSELGAEVKVGSGTFQGFRTRKVNTSAIVQDGHTLVIGGILQERVEQSRSGLPLLSRIPILGYLFGTTTDSIRKKELVLMITPHVVADHSEADLLTEEYLNKVKDLKKKIDRRKEKLSQSEPHWHDHGPEQKPR